MNYHIYKNKNIALKAIFIAIIVLSFFTNVRCYVRQTYSADNFRGRKFAIITNVDAPAVIIALRAQRI